MHLISASSSPEPAVTMRNLPNHRFSILVVVQIRNHLFWHIFFSYLPNPTHQCFRLLAHPITETPLGLESLLDQPIEHRTLSPLPGFDSHMREDNRTKGMKFAGVTGKMIQVVSLLVEYGMQTRAPFQPDINHREIYVHNFHYEHRDIVTNEIQPPMLVSLVRCKNTELFTEVSPVSLWAYETKESTVEGEGLPIKSGFACSLKADGEARSIILENRRCVLVSGKAFKQLLKFFGYQWQDANGTEHSDTDQVGLDDLLAFLAIFRDMEGDFASNTGFEKFIKQYKLDPFFVVDKTKCITSNIRIFGMMMRSLTPFRVGSNEGQHRLILTGAFLQGLFHISPDVPISPCSISQWNNLKKQFPDSSSMDLWKQCQIFNHDLRLRFGIPMNYQADPPIPVTDILVINETLKDFGADLTEAQVS